MLLLILAQCIYLEGGIMQHDDDVDVVEDDYCCHRWLRAVLLWELL